jgi:hypothetical protein
MSKRGRFGALAAALLLTFAVASVAFADQPTYSVSVTKTASPTSVPVAGGSVTFTVWVTNTGTGDFHGLSVTDSNANCTYDGPVASASDKFESGAAWKYTCTYTAIPGTNTVTVFACHDNGNCGSGNADATATASVTITVAAVVTAAPVITAKPAVKATVLNTATVDSRTSSTDGTWLAIVALGILLASVVILTPRRSKSRS